MDSELRSQYKKIEMIDQIEQYQSIEELVAQKKLNIEDFSLNDENEV